MDPEPPDGFFDLESPELEDVPSPEAPLLEVPPLEAPPLDPPSFEPLAPSPDPESDAALAFVLALEELERSFLAQPEPLKWTAGGTNTFRSVSSAPHAGQNRGAGASIPWMNSVRVLQVEQT